MRRLVPPVLTVLWLLMSGAATARENVISYCFVHWPPFTIDDGSAAPTGISVDIVGEATRRAGYTAQFTALPWKRCLGSVLDGRYDAALDSARRRGFLQGSVSFSFSANALWVRHSAADAAYLGPEQLFGRRVGVVAGYKIDPALLAERRILTEEAPSDLINLRKLDAGRVDYALASLMTGNQLARQYNFNIRPLAPLLYVNRLFPAFNRDRGARQAALEAALAAMMADGSIDATYRRYTGQDYRAVQRLLVGVVLDPQDPPRAIVTTRPED